MVSVQASSGFVFTMSHLPESQVIRALAVYSKTAIPQTLPAKSQQTLAHVIHGVLQDVAQGLEETAQQRFEE